MPYLHFLRTFCINRLPNNVFFFQFQLVVLHLSVERMVKPQIQLLWRTTAKKYSSLQ